MWKTAKVLAVLFIMFQLFQLNHNLVYLQKQVHKVIMFLQDADDGTYSDSGTHYNI